MKLTEHFTLEEMTTTSEADLKENNFAEGRQFLHELSQTANLLEEVRALLKWKYQKEYTVNKAMRYILSKEFR